MAKPHVTRRLEPWQAAETRQQIYAAILGLGSLLGPLADNTAEKLLAQDLREFVFQTFADVVATLNRIGWDVDHDLETMRAHDRAITRRSTKES